MEKKTAQQKTDAPKLAWSKSNTALVDVVSTLAVLSYNVKRKALRDEAMAHIKRWRYSRILQLQEAGMESLANEAKLAYIMRCPPCAIKLPFPLQRCTRRICPYCHARRAEQVYTSLQDCIGKLTQAGIPYKIVQFTMLHKHATHDAIQMCAGRITSHSMDCVLRKRHQPLTKKVRRRYLTDVYLGYMWYSLEPFLYYPIAATGIVGYWRVRRSVIAVVPQSWRTAPKPAVVNVATSMPPRRLAIWTGWAMRYPRQWMAGDANAVAQLFNYTRNVHLFSQFGKMRSADCVIK